MKALLAVLLASWVTLSAIAAPEAPPAAAAAASRAETALIDINRASVETLVGLKGVGEARAAAIVKGRPYARKDELTRRKIIPESVYADIKDLIVARQ